jgi:BspA type Leucine rich repeat region (6 copies)
MPSLPLLASLRSLLKRGLSVLDGVISIGYEAFAYTVITSIIIPASVVTIGVSSFSNCYSLALITLGNSVTTIGEAAFAFAPIRSINFPNSVIKIKDWAFFDCDQLTSLMMSPSSASLLSMNVTD